MEKFELIKSKIFTTETLKRQLAIWRFLDKKIVFTNGCFDIIHLGHIYYLSKAADLGNILIIGLNSDNSIRKLKGKKRPVNDQDSRKMILASLNFVDAVILFEEQTPYKLIKLIQPDVLVKGGDYDTKNIVGYDIVFAKEGDVKTIEFLKGYSTSKIEEKIIKINK
jgi:rfaE bifunctional protein nucleotidyltransferase chain/domain